MPYRTFSSAGTATAAAKKRPRLMSRPPVATGRPNRPQAGRGFQPVNQPPLQTTYGGTFQNPKPQVIKTPPPQSSQGQALRGNAQQALSGATNDYRDAIFRAAMGLGDQNVLSQLQADPTFAGYNFAQDPTSTMAQLAQQEREGLQDIDYSANDAGAYDSGFRTTNRQKFSQGVNDARFGAVKDYQDALREYAASLAAAQMQNRLDLSSADQADIDAAASVEPENQQSSNARPPKPKMKPKRKARGKK